MNHIYTYFQSRKIKTSVIVFCFILFSLLSFSHIINLSHLVPFHDWDEAIYAQVAKEWVRHPGILLTYNGSPWFEKPPLPTVVYAIAWIIPTFQPEVSARLITSILSITTIWILFIISHKISKNYFLALLAICITMMSSTYRDRSTLVNVDIFLTLGWVGYVWASEIKNEKLRYVFVLFGTLSKSLLGLIPLIADFLVDICTKSLTRNKLKSYIGMTCMGLSWHVAMICIYGSSFIQSHFIDHMVSRVTRPIELHFGDKFFYSAILWKEENVFVLLALFGIGYVVYQTINMFVKKIQRDPKTMGIHRTSLLVSMMGVGYFALLTMSKSKIHWYITPLFPLISLLSVFAWHTIHNLIQNPTLRKIESCILLSVCAFGIYSYTKTAFVINESWFKPTDKTLIGQCVGKKIKDGEEITYLVPVQERKDALVIEAAQLQIGSSFIYGSAPAFLYYANAPVHVVYRVDRLATSFKNSSILVLQKNELNDVAIRKQIGVSFTKLIPLCETASNVAYRLP